MIRGILVYAFSEELEEMTRFYREAMEVDGAPAGPNWMAFELGASKLAFHRQLPDDRQDKSTYRLDLLVEDIDAASEQFQRAGAKLVQGIQDEGFGKSVVLLDPEGREFTLVEEDLPG